MRFGEFGFIKKGLKMNLRYKIAIITFIILATIDGIRDCRRAYGEEIPYWQVIMAEAVSEGEIGMYAVACVIRNRGGKLNGIR